VYFGGSQEEAYVVVIGLQPSF